MKYKISRKYSDVNKPYVHGRRDLNCMFEKTEKEFSTVWL